MASKRKYPKSFYDDGLGDFLEWIDDEVLVHSEEKLGKKKSSQDNDDELDLKKCKTKKGKKKPKIYGENKIPETNNAIDKAPKRIRFDLEEEADLKVEKKLENVIRGLINRLAAQTMPFVTSKFEQLYSTNQRSSVNAAIFNNIESSIISEHALTKRKLVAELMLLVSYLNSKISQDIGAFLVHQLVYKFEKLYTTSDNDEDRSLDNILLCLVNLYMIGLISANVIFELTKRICSADFKPKSVELLLLIIKSVGFQLRKDKPTLMRQLIIMAQDSAKRLKANSEISTRIDFMMEALAAIKNNNMSKLGNYGCDIDKDIIESTLKSLIQRTKLQETLTDATYEEILASQNFYLLEKRVDEDANPNSKKVAQVSGSSSKTDLKICKALGLNKPAERTIFSALLRVSDHIEASNVIIGFGLNHCSDAMLVCIHVAVHEKKYNPFYFDLINNLCKFNRRYKMATKFSIQDKIRVLSQMSSGKVNIFKTLCLELLKSDAIPITILKAVEWADLSASTKEYLVFLLESISDLPEEETRKILSKVEKKSSFAGAMRTFTNCFLKGCHLFQ